MIIVVLAWVACGLLSVVWLPRPHASWRGWELVALWLFWILLSVGGPLVAFVAYRSYRSEPCRLWWQR